MRDWDSYPTFDSLFELIMAAPAIRFSTTSKGKRLLVFDGFMYTLNKDRGYIKYWRCEERTCAATVHTDAYDHLQTHNSNHNHLATPERIELVNLRSQVKQRVLQESTPVARIYDQELALANLSLPALSIAPSSKEAREYLFNLNMLIKTFSA